MTIIKFIPIDPYAAQTVVQASPSDIVHEIAEQYVGQNHALILIANGTRINETATISSLNTATNIYYAWKLDAPIKRAKNCSCEFCRAVFYQEPELANAQGSRNMLPTSVDDYFRSTGRPEFST